MSIIRDGFQSADLDAPVITPTLNLDFANSQELDPRITFSRGSVGTFVNKNGLIETAPANQPRFDYDPISGECRGLLIEESRTNLWLYSDNPASAFFDPSMTAFNSNSIISPDGTQNADKVLALSGKSFAQISQGVTITSGATVTGSVYIKDGGFNRVELVMLSNNNTTPYARATFDPTTGRITTAVSTANGGTNASANIVFVGNGWYRCNVTVTYPAVTLAGMRINATSSTGGVSEGTIGVYVWGLQVEQGAFPTSYIPTTTSSVTRSADNADMTGSNFTSWANSSVGTFVIRGRGGQSTSQTLRGRFVGIGVGGAISLEGAGTTVGIWDTTNSFTVTNNSADVVNRNSNIAASFDGTLRRIVLNGVASSGISRRNINTIFTQISLGKNGNNSNYLNGTLSRVAYYPRQLNDAQMLYLTT